MTKEQAEQADIMFMEFMDLKDSATQLRLDLNQLNIMVAKYRAKRGMCGADLKHIYAGLAKVDSEVEYVIRMVSHLPEQNPQDVVYSIPQGGNQ